MVKVFSEFMLQKKECVLLVHSPNNDNCLVGAEAKSLRNRFALAPRNHFRLAFARLDPAMGCSDKHQFSGSTTPMDPKAQLRNTLIERQTEAKRLTATLATLTEQLKWNALDVNNLNDQINEWGMYFLDFPLEIRLMIYKELLPSALHFPFPRTSGLQLLVSCRQVRAEFLPLIRALPTAVVPLHDSYIAEEFLQWIEPKPECPPVCLTGLVIEARMRRREYAYDDDLHYVTTYIDFREEVTVDNATKEIKVFCGKNYGDNHNVFSHVEWHPGASGPTGPSSDVWLPLHGSEITPRAGRIIPFFRFHEIDAILSKLAEYTSTDYFADYQDDPVPAHYYYTRSFYPRPTGVNRMEWLHWLNGKYRSDIYKRRPVNLIDVEYDL